MDTGSSWIISVGLLCTSEFVLDFVPAVKDYLLVMLVFSFKNSWILEVVEGALEGSVVLPVFFLFFLPSIFELPIPLAMVDELLHFVADY